MKQVDFHELFEMQRSLQALHGFDFTAMSIEEKEQYTKDTVLYLLEETHELLRETNFKKHKKVRKPVSQENIREELADMMHFFINLCHAWDISAEDLKAAFIKKNQKNVDRINSRDY